MPIWTQEQLFEIVLNNYKAIENAQANGNVSHEELAQAIIQTKQMENWLDAPFRDQLDVILNRVEPSENE